LAVFTAFNILANYKFPLSGALALNGNSMRLLINLIVVFLVTSCASTLPKIDFQSKRIGVNYNVKDNLKLCHSHMGITVFQNKSEEIEVNANFNDLVSKGYINGINDIGSTAIPIKSDIRWGKYLTYSKWDGEASLNQLGKNKLKEIGEKDNLDYIVISRDYSGFYKGKVCYGSWFKTNVQGIDNFVPVYVALVFNPSNGEYIGSTFINNKEHTEVYSKVSTPQELSTKDVVTLVNYSEKAAYKAIQSFLSSN
jgi:hypothetical protein